MNIHYSDLVLGVSGGDVRIALRLLRRLGLAISLTERQNETYGETTRNVVRRFQADNGLVVSGSIDSLTYAALKRKVHQTAAPDSYSVHGTILVGAIVCAADKELRSEIALGETTTATLLKQEERPCRRIFGPSTK